MISRLVEAANEKKPWEVLCLVEELLDGDLHCTDDERYDLAQCASVCANKVAGEQSLLHALGWAHVSVQIRIAIAEFSTDWEAPECLIIDALETRIELLKKFGNIPEDKLINSKEVIERIFTLSAWKRVFAYIGDGEIDEHEEFVLNHPEIRATMDDLKTLTELGMFDPSPSQRKAISRIKAFRSKNTTGQP